MTGLVSLAAIRLAGAILVAGAPSTPAASEHPSSQVLRATATASFVGTTAPPQPAQAQGDLQVARSALGTQAIAVLGIDVHTDATAASITLRTSGQPGSSYGSSSVSACRVTAAWSPGASQPMAKAPTFDCTNVAPVAGGTGTWTFDLEPLLPAWQQGAPNLGVALVDTVSAVPAEVTFNVIASEPIGTAAVAVDETRVMPSPTPAAAPPPRVVGDSRHGLTDLPQEMPTAASAPGPALPPVLAAPAGITRPVAQAIALRPTRVRAGVWFLIPLSLVLLVGLIRVTSASADGFGRQVTA